MIFFEYLAPPSLHTLFICFTQIIYLLSKDHTVSVWPYHSSENPYHPSTATGLQILKQCNMPLRAATQQGAQSPQGEPPKKDVARFGAGNSPNGSGRPVGFSPIPANLKTVARRLILAHF